MTAGTYRISGAELLPGDLLAHHGLIIRSGDVFDDHSLVIAIESIEDDPHALLMTKLTTQGKVIKQRLSKAGTYRIYYGL